MYPALSMSVNGYATLRERVAPSGTIPVIWARDRGETKCTT
jgi:hypothetical protein